ncbi:MAG: AmmeMemoRadiSam system protein B [Thermodesulfobacteriota bacterium]
MTRDIRKSTIAGSWYPGKADALRSQIEGFFKAVPDQPEIRGELRGLIVPHAGYVYSGPVAAYAYKLLLSRPFPKVVIIAPSHRYPFQGASVDSMSAYETPLGLVPVDQDLARKITAKNPVFRYVPQGHAQEHALEIQLPFLQETLGNFSIVPIIQGSQDPETCTVMAETLAEVLRRLNVLLLASTDLSHFHSYEQARSLDKKILDRLAAFDERGLMQDLSSDRVEACGGGPMVTVMKTARLLGADRALVLNYANSGDVTGERSGVVGYMAGALLSSEKGDKKEKENIFSEEEKNYLHRLAREAIEHHLLGKQKPSRKGESERLAEKSGAFVTLKTGGRLRGCIGHIQAVKPLSQTVIDMAEAAAFQDPRFPPLSAEELENLSVEISALTPLKKIEHIEEIEVGKHGLFLERGFYSGLLLPQVASEYGWDRRTFLEQTCQKAGLPKEAWKDKKTKIYIFSAEVF